MRRRSLITITAVAAAALVLSVTTTQPAATADPQPFTFTAAGDYSASAAAGSTLDAIRASGAALNLAVGDMSYGVTGQEQAWCDFVTSHVGAAFPFELLSGNHESNGQNGNINDFSACLPNELPGVVGTYGRQWYVDVPAGAPVARFVMISPSLQYVDGTWSYAAGTAHYNWTAAAIDDARAKGIPWVIVGMHKPCISLGEYTCDPGTDLVNMLLTKKVDLVLTGHEHLYQRTKQLALSGACPSLTVGTYQPACVADADSDLTKDSGTIFTTVGTGGVALRDVHADDTETGYFVTSSGLNSNPTFGALKIDLTPDLLNANFLRGSGGTFGDAFTITRRAAPPQNVPPTAAFAAPACTALNCTYDGTGSTDPDGTIASYAWNYGDGTTGTGATSTHTYTAAGTYTTTLTVTDNGGATATATRTVTPTAPPTGYTDSFSGANGSPWASAWVTDATSGSVVQNAGTGVIATNDVTTTAFARSRLTAQSVANSELLMSYAWNSTTAKAYFNTWIRGSVWSGSYGPRDGYGIQMSSNSTGVALQKSVNGTVTTLATVTNGQTVTTAKQWLRLRAVESTVQFRTWTDGQSEPTTWKSTVTDTSVAAAGQLFLSLNRSSANTGAKSVAIDDLSFGPAQ